MRPMRRFLIPHPDSPCPGVRSLEVEIRRAPGSLRLDYIVTGDIGALSLPLTMPDAHRGAPLWEHSCFEAFFAAPPGQPGEGVYSEYNFATWGGWAAYGFTGYRTGQAILTGIDPVVTAKAEPDRFLLSATLASSAAGPVRLGLSAVIEDKAGSKSWWALAHPNPEKPDFHHPDCFALELPPLV